MWAFGFVAACSVAGGSGGENSARPGRRAAYGTGLALLRFDVLSDELYIWHGKPGLTVPFVGLLNAGSDEVCTAGELSAGDLPQRAREHGGCAGTMIARAHGTGRCDGLGGRRSGKQAGIQQDG